jgi:hypothetical protein
MQFWGFNWATVGEIARFFLSCAVIAWIAVGAVQLMRYATKVYEERIRWWR